MNEAIEARTRRELIETVRILQGIIDSIREVENIEISALRRDVEVLKRNIRNLTSAKRKANARADAAEARLRSLAHAKQ